MTAGHGEPGGTLATWRFRGDPRPVRGGDALAVVLVLRARCQAGFDPALATGPVAPFCCALAARSGAPAVDPTLPDLAAANALLGALASVGEAAQVRPGALRLV